MFDLSHPDDDQEQLYDARRPRFDIAGPGPQRPAVELGAIDVPPIPRGTSATSGTNTTDATAATKPTVSMAGPTDHPITRSPDHPITSPSMSGPNDAQLALDQAELKRKQITGSGISQIHNPFLRGLARVGDIAGTTFLPGATAMIPGTELHHRQLLNQDVRAVNQDLGEQKTEAEIQEAQARAKKAEADINAPGSPEEQAFDDLLKQGKPPIEAFGEVSQAKQKPAAEHNAEQQAFDALIKKGTDPLEAFRQVKGAGQAPKTKSVEEQYVEEYLKSHQGSTLGDAVRAYVRDTQRPERPGAGENRNTARADKSYQYNSGQLDHVGKPIEDAVMRLGRLQDSLAQNTPQADALIAPELLTVMAGGAGSGLRMNEAEISRVVGGRSKWESLKAAANQWSLDPSKANSITPEQRQQIRALVNVVHNKLLSKQRILDEGRNALLDSDDPKDHRRIVTEARQKLSRIDQGEEAGGGETIHYREGTTDYDIPPDKEADFKTKHPKAQKQ